MASSLTTVFADLDFLSVIDTISIELSSHFSHTAATHDDWEYVGYIPIIAEESQKESTVTGSVHVKHVDTNGNEIQDPYMLVVDETVATVKTVTLTTNGVTTTSEETVASNLTYDATTQKPTLISYNGQYYEFVQVKEGDSEKGLVTQGTTTVTYIYKVVPNTKETVSTSVTGTVRTRYVDEDTGEEIVPGSIIIDNGVVANILTTTERNAAGEIVSQTTETIPTGVTYDTTADKQAKTEAIALIRVPATEFITSDGQIFTPDADGYITHTLHNRFQVKGDSLNQDSNQDLTERLIESNADAYKDLLESGKLVFVSADARWAVPPTLISTSPIDYVGTVEYDLVYKTYIGNETVSYSLVRADSPEEGSVEEGTKVITYYYRRLSPLYKDTFVVAFKESSTVATLERDW